MCKGKTPEVTTHTSKRGWSKMCFLHANSGLIFNMLLISSLCKFAIVWTKPGWVPIAGNIVVLHAPNIPPTLTLPVINSKHKGLKTNTLNYPNGDTQLSSLSPNSGCTTIHSILWKVRDQNTFLTPHNLPQSIWDFGTSRWLIFFSFTSWNLAFQNWVFMKK